MRETGYAKEVATADINGCRIERIIVKEFGQPEIRFSWWKDGRFQTRPLDLSEQELLPLVEEAIRQGVFSEWFLQKLHSALYNTRREAKYASEPED